jgi:hypothetical protein
MLSHLRTNREELNAPRNLPPQTKTEIVAHREDVLKKAPRREAWVARPANPWPPSLRAGRRTSPLSAVTQRLVEGAPPRVVRWVRFWMRSHEYRRRRAYFRPRDRSSLDPSFVNLIDRMVVVRLAAAPAADSSWPGECLYRCSFGPRRGTILRPASDLDFLD